MHTTDLSGQIYLIFYHHVFSELFCFFQDGMGIILYRLPTPSKMGLMLTFIIIPAFIKLFLTVVKAIG